MQLSAGDLFRHYRVIERVGEGGMGVVYRAHDTRLSRDVALKFIIHGRPVESQDVGRLRREARALGALNHPNIVTIYDIGESDGLPFLALEWVDGGRLGEKFFKEPLPAGDFLQVALPVAAALGAAHARGIVHRDVKPWNVLVTSDGRIKLADFGLAKIRIPEADEVRTAGAVGTVAYMSPEQAAGDEVGPRSDVFSFGILAYKLLAGKVPFSGDSPGAVVGAILNKNPVPLEQLRSDLPEGFAEVIRRCLKKAPEARYSDGRELEQALRNASSPGEEATTVRKPLAALRAEAAVPARREQEIRFCTTADGVRIAYSTVGSGPFLVRVLGHFTHLEMEWEWPDLRRFWELLAERHTVVRYDGRGMGLSERFDGEFDEATRQQDLEAVLSAVGAEKAILLGISEGGWTAATYAIQHTDQITHIIFYGAYRRGARARPSYDLEEDQALMTLIRKGWGRDTPAIRQLFTSQFFQTTADPELIAYFNEIQRAAADPETAARYHESCHRRGEGKKLYEKIRVPSLVIHCKDDLSVSAEEGRLLAAAIPGAQLVLLPSGTHYFPTDSEVVTKAAGAIDRFTGGSGGGGA